MTETYFYLHRKCKYNIDLFLFYITTEFMETNTKYLKTLAYLAKRVE